MYSIQVLYILFFIVLMTFWISVYLCQTEPGLLSFTDVSISGYLYLSLSFFYRKLARSSLMDFKCPPGKCLNPQRWNDPRKTGQCSPQTISVWGRLQASMRASQTWNRKRFYLREFTELKKCAVWWKNTFFSVILKYFQNADFLTLVLI